MEFRKAWFHLLNGEKIKRPSWGGYWAWEDDTIMMHCKDGRVLDIRATEDTAYTFNNVAADDWEVIPMSERKESVNISSPWILFYREIEALFKEDPAVRVEYDGATQTVKLYVEDAEKADALAQLLPAERTFGNVTVKIAVYPANVGSPSKLQLFQKAFEGNPAFAFIHKGNSDAFNAFDLNYVVFKGKVVQFFSDDLGDLNGLRSALYQDIAKDVFEGVPGIFFCTEPVE